MQEPHLPEEETDDAGQSRRKLLMLVLGLVIVVAGVWLVNKLIAMNQLQTCLESGRTNCAPIAR